MKKNVLIVVLGILLSCTVHASTLVLQDSETKVLTPDTYIFDSINLGRNATLLLTGTTKISTKKMTSDIGARIEYKKGADIHNNAKYFELVVLDGTEMRGILSISGSGADGNSGSLGANGGHGDSEHTKTDICYERKLGVKIPYPCIHHTDPTPGGHGGHGGNATDGEEAMDIEISMYKLHPSVHVILISNGGSGGDGGNGGHGGNGGRGKRIAKGKNGGNGGNGGNAGNGGDAGDINVMLVYRDDTPKEQLDELREFLEKNIHAIPGVGGRAGIAGNGGRGGDGSEGGKVVKATSGGKTILKIGRGGGNAGSSGAPGRDGSPGDHGSASKKLIEGKEWIELKRKTVDDLLKK